MEAVGLITSCLLGAFVMSLLFLNIPYIKRTTASGLFPPIFLFSLVTIVTILGTYHLMSDSSDKHRTTENKQPTSYNKKELVINADKWLNSFDDDKFSTSELYTLRTLQNLTGVKVYENALEIQKVYNQDNIKKFKESLFEARDNLEKGYVKKAKDESI